MSQTRAQQSEGLDMGDLQEVDFLTCGACQKEFLLSNIVSFMRHKKQDCDDTNTVDSADLYYRLICQIKECREQFATAWALLQHVQTRHIPNIYTALEMFSPGIKSIQVETSQRPAVTTSSGSLSSFTQTGVDVRSLCMLGLGDTFDISQTAIQELQIPEKSKDQEQNVVASEKTYREKKVGSTQVRSMETQTDAMQICTDERCRSDNCADQKCCDDQNCCITIMPGTHEKPKKCCSAIVPKKRKQHMEAKHMPAGSVGVSTRSQKRRAGEQRRTAEQRRAADRQYSISSQNDTIYIDVTESNVDVSDDYQDTPQGSPMPADPNEKFSRTVTVSSDSVVISTGAGQGITSGTPCTGKGSMIIQPGSTVTIPPPAQPVFPTSTELSSTISQGHLQPLLMRPTNLTPSLTFPYLLDTSLHASPQLGSAVPNQQENIASINFTNTGDKPPKLFITSSQGLLQSLSSSATTDDVGANLTISSPGSPVQDSKSSIDDSLELRGGGKKRRYPTSRPFKCEQCGMSFNQRIHLKKHLSKHTGIKPYKCGQCDYSTVERSHLKVHIRIHTGEKPFKCTFCEYATAQNSTLKIHLKRHHSGKETGCGKGFNQLIHSHHKAHSVSTDTASIGDNDQQAKLGYPDVSGEQTP